MNARVIVSVDVWRDRLRLAVQRTGEKRSVIAYRAEVTPETLSRVLSGTHARPQFETVVRIANACGVSVGWLLDERYAFNDDDRRKLRNAAAIIIEATK